MKIVGKWLLYMGGAAVLILLLRTFAFTPYLIPSAGMENTLLQGDQILVNKWSYGLRMPLMSRYGYRRYADKPVQAGDLVVFNNPVSSQPVIDEREVFISRCMGLPGDTLQLDSLYTLVSNWEKAGPDRKRLYTYPADKEACMDSLLTVLNIGHNAITQSGDSLHVRSFSHYEYYLIDQALDENNPVTLMQTPTNDVRLLVVPRAGQTVQITPHNLTLYRNTIVMHEGKSAEVVNDSLYVDGRAVHAYTFARNYHWMVSNNSINMADSRLFGFVPEQHLIGKAVFIWFSKTPGGGVFDGIRWERMMKSVK